MRALHWMNLSAVLLLGACAGVPTEPGLLALPGTGKTLEQFNGDDAECRRHASSRAGEEGGAGGSWLDLQRRYDYAYIQCMYVKGHRVPVPGTFTSPPAGNRPPPPPPPPPPPKPE